MRARRIDIFVAATLFGSIIAAPAFAAGPGPDPAPAPAQSSSSPPKPDQGAAAKKKSKKAAKKPQQSLIEYDAGFRAAYRLIYVDHDYAAGIAQLHSLRRDEQPDVANLIGYSSRKLGRYEDSKYWYERALASDPNHARTWSYYGMWHAEQGNLLKAHDHLEKVRTICGTDCREYTELRGVIDGTRSY